MERKNAWPSRPEGARPGRSELQAGAKETLPVKARRQVNCPIALSKAA